MPTGAVHPNKTALSSRQRRLQPRYPLHHQQIEQQHHDQRCARQREDHREGQDQQQVAQGAGM